jgi:hypothetical protein
LYFLKVLLAYFFSEPREGKLSQTGLPKFYKQQNPRPSTQRTFLKLIHGQEMIPILLAEAENENAQRQFTTFLSR